MQEVDAADLVQEVFALLIEKMPQFVYQQHRSFRAWLKTVTVNKWRESCRRRAAMPRTAALSSGDLAGKEESDAFWKTEYRQQVLDRALQLIEHDFQPATWKASLQVIAGRPVAEVSRELGLTIGAASGRGMCSSNPPAADGAAVGGRSAVSKDGKWIATGDNQRLTVWDTANPKKPVYEWKMPMTTTCLGFAPDNRHLAAGFDKGVVYILRLQSAAAGFDKGVVYILRLATPGKSPR